MGVCFCNVTLFYVTFFFFCSVYFFFHPFLSFFFSVISYISYCFSVLQRQPEIHLFAARFKEQNEDIDGARAAYQLVHTGISPGLLEAIIKHANMEHRLVRLLNLGVLMFLIMIMRLHVFLVIVMLFT